MTPCVCSIFGRNNQQDLFTLFGAMFVAVIFLGINNCSSVIPYVTTERNVLYRERFAGMYSPWAYSVAQVIIYIEVILRTCIYKSNSLSLIATQSLEQLKLCYSI